MEIEYKKLGNQDLDNLIALISLYEDVFEMKDFSMPSSGYLLNLLSNDKIIFFTALSDSIVVGGLTAHILPSTHYTAAEVYIYDLAVKTEWQRNGIGRQLLLSLINYCKPLGTKEIFVQADLEDDHAIEFYKATGGRPESVVHFTYSLTD